MMEKPGIAKWRKRKKGEEVPGHKQKLVKKRGVVVNIPRTAEECGTNWKALLSEINKEKEESKHMNRHIKCTKKFSDKHRKNKKETKNEPAEIWFDDVELEDVKAVEEDSKRSNRNHEMCKTDKFLVKSNAFEGLTKAVGMDCEMVGIGERGSQSILARVSLVNQFGKRIYDKHVKPREHVTDYRTFVSGIRPSDLKEAEEFEAVQREVAEILKGRILVGHALWNDLKVLYIDHPKKMIRDTAEYKPFREYNNGRTPALRKLSKQILGVHVQSGEHSSLQDAQAAVKLYMMHKKQWEKELQLFKRKGKRK